MEEGKSLEIELRKCLERMYIFGTGVILFSVWGLFKGIILSILPKARLENLNNIAGDLLPWGTVYLLVGSSILVDFLLRLIIGYCARAEGEGKKQNPFYIAVAVFLAFSYVFTIIVRIIALFRISVDILDQIIMILIDVTSFFILAELIYSAIEFRRVTRLLKKQ